MNTNFIAEIKEIVGNVAEIDLADFDENTDLVDELEVDSMMALEILTTIEKRYKVTIPQKELPKFTNVRNIAEIIERYTANSEDKEHAK